MSKEWLPPEPLTPEQEREETIEYWWSGGFPGVAARNEHYRKRK
jgi:hypothetical protein